MRLNIKQRFAVLFLCSALLPLAVVTAGSFVSARAALERFINAELALVTGQALEDLEGLFGRMLSDLETWRGQRVMQDALIDDEAGEIAAELGRLRENYAYFEALAVFNADGSVIATTAQAGIMSLVGGRVARVLTGSGAFFSSVDGGAGEPGSLVVGVPIAASYDPQTIIGALVGIVDWSEVQKRLATISFAGARQDADRALILRLLDDGRVWYQTPLSPDFDLGDAGSATDRKIATTADSAYLLQSARSTASASPDDPKWEVSAAIGMDVAFASVSRLRWQILALVSLLSAAALLVARVAANDLVRPIVSMIAVMKRLAEGRSDTRIPALERKDEIGDMAVALSVFKDQAEERLRLMAEREAMVARALDASEERFRDIAEAASDWIWETDAEFRWTYLSERFVGATGLKRDALLGQPWSQVLNFDGSVDDPDENDAIGARGPFRNLSCTFQGRDGRKRHCRVSARPMFDAEGTFMGYRGATSDVTAEVQAQARAKHLALHDALTGLPNRTLLAERLEHALAGARRGGHPVNVLCLDLDRFKDVNDTLGHAAGDQLLKKVAALLVDNVREMDTVSRVGGDEFVILQVGRDGADDAQALCQRLLENFSAGFDIDGHRVDAGLSIGIAVAPVDGQQSEDVLKKADIALYQAKDEGRGMFRFFKPEMNARLQERRSLEADLRAAMAEGAFFLHYQPQVEAESGRLVGVEALLRWNHPERGAVGPMDYIPIAEETGLIHKLGAWVLRTACSEAVCWGDISIAVNVSPVQFSRGDLVALVREVLDETGLAPERLELEITEGILMQDAMTATATLKALKELGVRVAMDDFGTGYSSLAYMQRFQFDTIKIDRSFTSQLSESAEAAAIVRAVVGLGRSLGIPTVAEGVETEAQADFLVAEGCFLAQGYLFGRPASASDIDRLMDAHRPREALAGSL